MSDIRPLAVGVKHLSPQWWAWFDSLDHALCSHVNVVDGQYTSRTCRSLHCTACGKSVSSQGHQGFCPAEASAETTDA